MTILNIIKNNQDLRRIFGKREIQIIQKQLLGVKLNQSERNRISRDIRKKLRVVKDLAQFSSEFGLKYGAELKKLIEETKEAILESPYLPKIKRILSFGSTILNQRNLNSDIDIAVEFYEINKAEASKFRLYLMKRVPEIIDIQVYNILPDKIKKDIDKKSKEIWKKGLKIK